jgi:hypothetical protein
MKNVYLRPLAFVLPVLTAGFLLAGCPKSEPTTGEAPYGQAAPSTATTPAGAPSGTGEAVPPGPKTGTAPNGPSVPPGPGGPMAGGPMMGGGMMGDPMAPLSPTPELDKAIKDAEAKKDKKAVAAAYANRGYARMTDDAAGQRIKYRKALEDFRTALQNDPTNAKATSSKKMIEDIYKSMGRPVPGEEGK